MPIEKLEQGTYTMHGNYVIGYMEINGVNKCLSSSPNGWHISFENDMPCAVKGCCEPMVRNSLCANHFLATNPKDSELPYFVSKGRQERIEWETNNLK